MHPHEIDISLLDGDYSINKLSFIVSILLVDAGTHFLNVGRHGLNSPFNRPFAPAQEHNTLAGFENKQANLW